MFFHAGTADSPNLKKMEEMMLESAKLDREIEHFVTAVNTMTSQVMFCELLYGACTVSYKTESREGGLHSFLHCSLPQGFPQQLFRCPP